MSITPRFRLAIAVRLVAIVLATLCCGPVTPGSAQEAAATNAEFAYHRTVALAAGPANPRVVVTQFFTHGQLAHPAQNLAVFDGRHRLVPWRVLQVGPDDFCRVAFQTEPKEHLYTIKYGGHPEPVSSPPWTASAGLLLETYRWGACDLHALASVRQAIAASRSWGSDYVPSVFHRYNPIAPGPEPFFSVYRGTLWIETPGRYAFFTSSQDCSFLLIDGREVVAAPGAHGPVGDARIRGEIELATRGPHRFEYVHAASGPDACMVAAWQPPSSGKPEPIPPQAFGSGQVVHLPAAGPWSTTGSRLHDFTVDVLGEVTLAEGVPPFVRVQFHAASRGAGGKTHWNFGDGQISTLPDPVHIYLHPGLYQVKLSSPGEPARLAAVNRVQIDRALVLADSSARPDQLSGYLPVLEKYDVGVLDPLGVLQLVRAHEQSGQLARAVKVGQAGLSSGSMVDDEATALDLARRLGSLLRDRLDRAGDAVAVWRAASGAVQREDRKAECELEAADISINDVLDRETAKELLDSASSRLEQAADPVLRSRLERLRGDWYARAGDAAPALAAYRLAEQARLSQRPPVEQAAWRGAFSRSTEAYLRDRTLDLAIAELRRWQEESPGDKAEGYLSLLFARYRAEREHWERAIAVAGDLIAIHPDSAQAGRLALLSAACDVKLGRTDRAIERLARFITASPGSPQVPEARDMLARLKSRQPVEAKGPKKR